MRRIINDADLKTAADINIESTEKVLYDMMNTGEIGHRTYNHYVQAMDQFCHWLVTTKRIVSNPLVGMRRLNTRVDVRHPRRALRADEIGKLIESARDSGITIQCFDGEQRARIYILSYMTGLRRKELAGLTLASFDLKSELPTVTVEAACSKRRRTDVLPLHPELVAMLLGWLAGMERDEPLFPKLGRRRTWLMVKKDLARVGIPYRTAEGIADFHASGRHTYITELLRNGATLPEVRELARHSDVRMTMNYTHIGLEDQARAVKNLPTDKKWRHYGGSRRVTGCQDISSGDTDGDSEDAQDQDENPFPNRGFVTEDQQLSPLDTPSKSGGGGNRTRVPQWLHESFYVCSRLFDFARTDPSRQDSTHTSRERVLAAGVPNNDPRRFGIGDQHSGLSDKSHQSGLLISRQPKQSYLQQLKMCGQLLTWPTDQPRHATRTSSIRSNPVRPQMK